jgi:formate-dependent nitrite reductase membrane component NrfD
LSDGREIDLRIAELSGEAGQQRVAATRDTSILEPWETAPSPVSDGPAYYDRPLLKEPVWKPYIPLYYYAGGAAGASLALAAAAQLEGSRDLDRMIRRCHWTGIIGSSIGGILLIADLGRPARFLFMLRVFRPTSPMNMGAWVLAAAPAAAVTAGLFARTAGLWAKIGEAAGYFSGVFGLALSTYTGVLVANSAIPLWQESRRELPPLFGASAMSSAAAILNFLPQYPRAARLTRAFGTAGAAAELAAGLLLERRVSAIPSVVRPLRHGATAALWRAGAIATAGCLLALLLPKQSRKTRAAAGAFGTMGSLAIRFAIHFAGVRSARDPRASFHSQRS